MVAHQTSPLAASLFALVEGSVDPIAVFDAELRHVYVNASVCRLMGLSREALLGRRYDELPMTPANAVAMQEAVALVFREGAPLRLEVRTGRTSPLPTVFDIVYHPHREGGEVVFVAGVSRDISALRFAEERARETAERLRLTFDSVGVAILGIDRELKLRFANALAERELALLGPYLGPGQRLVDLVPPELAAPLVTALETTLSTGVPSTRERDVHLGGRTRRFQILIRPEPGPHPHAPEVAGCIVVARDVTAERQLESQLQLSERLASLGRIAAGVAHEIANPLTAVYGNIELAARGLRQLAQGHKAFAPALDEAREMLTEARDGAERIRQIVDDIGLLARDEDTATGRVALDEVVRTVVQMLGASIRKAARLEVVLEPVPLLPGSAPRLVQVLSNLVHNALHAMPEGRPAEDNLIAIRLARSTSEILLTVTDNGRGIPPGDQERIFDPFFTTRAVGEGAGLGLTIAHGVVAQHGGRLALESTFGLGTTATIRLPLPEPEG